MDMTKSPDLNAVVKPYHLFPDKGLAVIGFITNTTGFISNAGPTIQFKDPVPVVQMYINQLRKQGFKRIIAVSHNGYDQDQDVARRTSGLDLIVGGHSHTYLSADPKDPQSYGLYPTKVTNLAGEASYVVQADCFGKHIGNLDVTFDDNGLISHINGTAIALDSSVPLDTAMQAKITKWRQPFDAFGKTVVGNAAVSFSTNDCGTQECALGDLLADAMVMARNGNVRAGFTNSGGIRAGIAAGTIHESDVQTVLPFGDELADLTITGQQLRAMFEDIFTGKSKLGNKPVTSFIQLSGFRVTYSKAAPDWQKVTSLEIATADGKGFEPVVDTTSYTVVTLDYIINGGDAFFNTPPGPVVPLIDIADALTQLLAKENPVKPAADVGQRIIAQ